MTEVFEIQDGLLTGLLSVREMFRQIALNRQEVFLPDADQYRYKLYKGTHKVIKIKNLASIIVEDLEYYFVIGQYRLFNGRSHEPARVLVNGSPKSGTTWMYKMICSIPNYHFLTNFKGDIQKYHTVSPGHVVHGHDWYRDELGAILDKNRIKTIMMIRDPRDQLVSRVFHIKRSKDHNWHERFAEMSIEDALLKCIEGGDNQLPSIDTMGSAPVKWLKEYPNACYITYEDLHCDPLGKFNEVLTYLGIQNSALTKVIVKRNRFERLSNGRRFWESQRKPGQEDRFSHYRKGIVGDWRNYLKEAHKQKIKEVIGEELIELGYEQDLNW